MSLPLKNTYKKIIPFAIRKRINYYKNLNGLAVEKNIKAIEKKIRRNNKVNILFITSSLPMWRYQSLIEKLKQDPHFSFSIIFSPFVNRDLITVKREEKVLADYFNSKGIKIYSTLELKDNLKEWVDNSAFDMIFYCQPYSDIHNNYLDYKYHKDKLLAYYPYSLPTVKEEWAYNSELHNIAWRYYLPTKFHLKTAKRLMSNNAKNVIVVGEEDAMALSSDFSSNDPWKQINDNLRRKRIIWAPHFSIYDNFMLPRGAFLWLYDFMLDMASKYEDKIQIVFKPHPHLYSTLCNHPDWGKEKVDEYYDKWRKMKNTQLEEGGFKDFFITSDALIHDSGSFTGEYLFTRKPVVFTSKNIENIKNQLCDFGNACLNHHYIADDTNEVENIIKNVILKGCDTIKDERESFYDGYLVQEQNTGELIYRDILKLIN